MRENNAVTKAIEAEDLNLFFQDQPALRNVGFTLDWGECLTILGPNGSGKTTLMRAIATLLMPTAGTIWVKGKPTTRFRSSDKRIFGAIFHHTLLYPDLTTYENLKFYGLLYGMREVSNRAYEVADELNLAEVLNKKVRLLSRGTQTRIAFARALVHNPSILLLDEPDTGLDHHAKHMLVEQIDRHRSRGGSTFMITHDINLAREVGDKVLMLSRGKVAAFEHWNDLHPEMFQEIGFQVEDKNL